MSSTQQVIRARKNAVVSNPSPLKLQRNQKRGRKRGQHAKKNGPRTMRKRQTTGR